MVGSMMTLSPTVAEEAEKITICRAARVPH